LLARLLLRPPPLPPPLLARLLPPLDLPLARAALSVLSAGAA
jgi:hypothetical protein